MRSGWMERNGFVRFPVVDSRKRGMTIGAMSFAQLLPQERVRQRLHVRGLLVVGRAAVAALDVLVVEHVVARLAASSPSSCGRGRGARGRRASRS